MIVPLAVVHGAADPFIKLDIVDGLKYGNLWRGKCIRLRTFPILARPGCVSSII
jgi:hypothetical protein